MVLLAAAVCNKSGKAIISRQFIEMTRSRIEGLLASFPKLMGSGKQHTFVETDSVRYVYQPLEKLYMLLITTKASNILEDLETLRLFSRVIPEYCKVVDESQIIEQAFPLIFAFDEIVALGYRENVNLAQVRTFTEMDSHDEKVFLAVRQNQEKEVKEAMKKRAREIQDMKKDAGRQGRTGYIGGGISNNMTKDFVENVPVEKPYVAPSVTKPMGGGKALKLKGKNDAESFVDQLKVEGEHVASPNLSKASIQLAKNVQSTTPQENIHLRMEEKIILTAGREGGLQSLELLGLLTLKVSNEKQGRIKLKIINNDDKGTQLQTHPNVDKKFFLTSSIIQLKNIEKPFPLNTDVGVLKWRLQTQDEHLMPLCINCWPNESGNKCDVNIEYELQREDMQLNHVVITIPLPNGSAAPVVSDCEGEYRHDARKNLLEWKLPLIDLNNKTGSLEFSCSGNSNDFFPVNVSFVSLKPFCNIIVESAANVDDDAPQKYSLEILVYVDKYEIV